MYAARTLLVLCLITGSAVCAQVDTSLGDSGLKTTSADGQFELRLTTSTQFRYTYHDVRAQGAQDGTGQNGGDFDNFRVIQARSFFEGHIFGPQHQYRVWLAWMWPGATGFRLEDCFYRWAPIPLFNVTAGQMRVPSSWNYKVDHERQVFTDRDIADEAFHESWGKGIEISGLWGMYDIGGEPAGLNWNVGVFNGSLASPDGAQGRGAVVPGGTGASDGIVVTDRNNTNHYGGGFRNQDFATNADSFNQLVDADLMVAARVEFHPLGMVPLHQADIENNPDSGVWKVMIAFAGSYFSTWVSGSGTFLGNEYYNQRGSGVPIPPPASGRNRVKTDIFHGTVDGHFRWLGLAINWALHLRTVKFTATGAQKQLNLEDDMFTVKGLGDLGASVDVNYFLLPDLLNLALRFACVNFDEFRSRTPVTAQPVEGDSMGADGYEYGIALSWSIHGDSLKINLDYRNVAQQLPHGVAESGETGLSGVARHADWYNFQEVRVQLQWIF